MDKLQKAMGESDMKGTELTEQIGQNVHEITMLNHRNKELSKLYEATKLKLAKLEAE